MRAVQIHQFGDVGVLEVNEVAIPTPGSDQIRLKVFAAGVNPVDTYVRNGIYGDTGFPRVLGFDAAGVIDAVGPGVDQAIIGQRVYTCSALPGSYAEYALVNLDRVYPLPDNTTFAQGAAIGIPYATAYAALHTWSQACSESIVLVHGGSGGVGIATVEIAKAAGSTVIASCGTNAGEGILREHGADLVVRHDQEGYVHAIRNAFPSGVDIIIEMCAHINLATDLTLLQKGGTVVVVGSRGPVQINPRDIMIRDAKIQGMLLFNATSDERQHIHQKLYTMLLDDVIRPRVAIELTLESVMESHHRVLQSGIGGKIVLIP